MLLSLAQDERYYYGLKRYSNLSNIFTSILRTTEQRYVTVASSSVGEKDADDRESRAQINRSPRIVTEIRNEAVVCAVQGIGALVAVDSF